MTPRFLIRWLAVLVLLSSFGCGLDDYERRMQKSEALANHFDEEFQLLDEPLLIPKTKIKDPTGADVEYPVVNVFLRPPKGISNEFIKDPSGLNVLRYRRKPPPKATLPTGLPTPGPAGTAAPPAASDFLEVTLAWGKEADKKKFSDSILRLFPTKGEVSKKEWSVIPLTRPLLKLEFETYQFFDPQDNYCSVSFRSQEVPKAIGVGKDTQNVAVAYKVEKGKQTAQVLKAQTLSLETLAMEKDEVFLANRDYTLHFPPPPAPPPPQPGFGPRPGLPVPQK